MLRRSTFLGGILVAFLLLGCVAEQADSSPAVSGGGSGGSTGIGGTARNDFDPDKATPFDTPTNIPTRMRFGSDPSSVPYLDPERGYSAQTATVSVTLSDRHNQVVQEPHTVHFYTNWGFFSDAEGDKDEDESKSLCVTDASGGCSVTWNSGCFGGESWPGAADSLVAQAVILAWVKGEEIYDDVDGDDSFSDGDFFYAAGDLLNDRIAFDLSEPYFDLDGTAGYQVPQSGVLYNDKHYDLDGDEIFDEGNGEYDGSRCSHTSLCSDESFAYIWGRTAIALYDISLDLDDQAVRASLRSYKARSSYPVCGSGIR